MKISKAVRNSAWSVLGLFIGSAANAQLAEPPVPEMNINMVGLAVASVPDYSGSDDNTGAIGPIFRYQFKDSERFFLWLGPTMTLNLLNDKAWRAGPMLNIRPERGDDVDDEVVSRMDKIDTQVEGGVFVQYKMKLSDQPFHQILFTGDVAGSSEGTVGHLRAMYYHPLSDKLIANVGLGTTFANDEFVKTYYGVTSANDISLFPSLGGRSYEASGGFIGVNIPFGISWLAQKQWLITAGGRYEALQGDAKDSPIVSERGSSDQWILGVGVSYLF